MASAAVLREPEPSLLVASNASPFSGDTYST
jgi:hypothetical protein